MFTEAGGAIDRSSFPSWDDTTRLRTFEMHGDGLSSKVPPPRDGLMPITVLRGVQ